MDDAIKQGVKGNVESSKQAIGSDKQCYFRADSSDDMTEL